MGANTWDQLWAHIKPMGRWQLIIVFFASFSAFFAAQSLLGQSFIASKFEHYCDVPQLHESSFSDVERRELSIPMSAPGEYDSCLMYDTDYDALSQLDFQSALRQRDAAQLTTRECSDGWLFNESSSQYGSSIQIDFELVCDRAPMLARMQVIVMTSFLIGVPLWGVVSDRYGRRPVILWCIVAAFFCGTAQTLAPSYEVLAALRFFDNFFRIGSFTIGFVLAMEIIGGSSYRNVVGEIFWIPWTLGYSLLAVCAYFFQDWRIFIPAFTVPSVVLFSMFCFFPESPRWLVSKGDIVGAHKVLTQAASVNGGIVPVGVQLETLGASENKQEVIQTDDGGLPLLQLFARPRLLPRTLTIMFLWFVNAGVYFGIALNAGDLAGNKYVNFTLGGIVEIPAIPTAIFLYHYFGRRAPLGLLLLLTGAFCLTIMAIDWMADMEDYVVLVVALSTAGKFCISMTFNMVYIFSAELYPTVARGAGISISSSFGRVASALSPLLLDLGDTVWHPLPQLVFGSVAIVGGLLTFTLPETSGRPLPQTFEDAERLGDAAAKRPDINQHQRKA